MQTFCPHLGSFCVVSSFTKFRPNFTFGLLQVILPRPRIGMLSLVTVSPVITVFHSCCLLHHVTIVDKTKPNHTKQVIFADNLFWESDVKISLKIAVSYQSVKKNLYRINESYILRQAIEVSNYRAVREWIKFAVSFQWPLFYFLFIALMRVLKVSDGVREVKQFWLVLMTLSLLIAF